MFLLRKYIMIAYAPDGLEGAGLDAIADSLISGGEPDKVPPKTPVNNRASPDDIPDDDEDTNDSQDEGFEDPDVDAGDVDLLEGEQDDSDGQGEEDDQGEIDPDEVEHEVVVDGQPTKAKLKDLKASYSGNKAIEQRLQQASEFRKQNEVMTVELMRQLNGESERLKRLDAILAEAEGTNIDWENLRITDPQRYLIEKDKLQELQNKRGQLAKLNEENANKQRALMVHRQNEYAKEEAYHLMTKLPELRNTEKAKAVSTMWNKAATSYGFSDQEVAGIIDHRMLLVLNDAAKYRALVAAKQARGAKGQQPGVKRSNPKPLLRPGNQNFGSKMNNLRAEKEANARAEKSGTVDDVAATLLVNAPARRALKKTGF